MSEMGRYCKAYLIQQLRQYPGWKENVENVRQPDGEESGGQGGSRRVELKDDDIAYLQESYAVTDGIFKDEHVIFDEVTEEWQTFCKDRLGFAVPTEVAAVGVAEAPSEVEAEPFANGRDS